MLFKKEKRIINCCCSNIFMFGDVYVTNMEGVSGVNTL